MNKTEELIGIFGVLCDYMVDNGRCDVFCPYAETKDKDDECEAWRTIQKIRSGGIKMSKFTLGEAIKHCLEVAEQNETQADKIGRQLIGSAIDKYATDCRECAADHRQLAEWLTELKQWRRVYGICPSYEMCIPECKEGYNAQIAEYKRLLKSATDIIKDVDCNEDYLCDECEYRAKCDGGFSFYWRYANEAEKLLNDEK